MLELKFREAALLKRLVDALRDISKEVNIHCGYESMTLQTMDESHVALISMALYADDHESFIAYRCDSECVLGVDMNSLHKMVGPFANAEPLIMRFTEGASQLCFVGTTKAAAKKSKADIGKKFKGEENAGNDDGDRLTDEEDGHEDDDGEEENENRRQPNDKKHATDGNKWNRVANLKLTTVDQEQYQIPEDTNFQAHIALPCSRFSHVIRGNVGVSESLKITVKPLTIEMSVDGELGHTSTVFHKGLGELKNAKQYPWVFCKEESQVRNGRAERVNVPLTGLDDDCIEMVFAISYLQKFIKAAPLSDKVFFGLSPGVPLRLRFPIGHNDASNKSSLEFYLAPKLDNNEDGEDEDEDMN